MNGRGGRDATDGEEGRRQGCNSDVENGEGRCERCGNERGEAGGRRGGGGAMNNPSEESRQGLGQGGSRKYPWPRRQLWQRCTTGQQPLPLPISLSLGSRTFDLIGL